jgi:outer membrane protein assembly factor BamA
MRPQYYRSSIRTKRPKTVSGEPLNKAFMNEDIQMIHRYYQISGFSESTVNYKIVPIDDRKHVKVVFDIFPGKEFHILKINFLTSATLIKQNSEANDAQKYSHFSFFLNKLCHRYSVRYRAHDDYRTNAKCKLFRRKNYSGRIHEKKW